MVNYKESPISGTEYQRARLISITNDLNSPNTITFVEELIKHVGNKEIHSDVSEIYKVLTPENQLTSFDLLNPMDDTVIGSATYQDLYVLLYSMYIALVAERDAVPPTTIINPSTPAV